MNWFLQALKTKYATFEGRARRKEYWYFVLFFAIGYVLLVVVDGLTGTLNEETGLGLTSGIYLLAMFLPSLAVTARRLHDINRSGWWVLLGLIPIIGDIVLAVFACLDSQPGANQYGPNPKGMIGAGTPVAQVVRE